MGSCVDRRWGWNPEGQMAGGVQIRRGEASIYTAEKTMINSPTLHS